MPPRSRLAPLCLDVSPSLALCLAGSRSLSMPRLLPSLAQRSSMLWLSSDPLAADQRPLLRPVAARLLPLCPDVSPSLVPYLAGDRPLPMLPVLSRRLLVLPVPSRRLPMLPVPPQNLPASPAAELPLTGPPASLAVSGVLRHDGPG